MCRKVIYKSCGRKIAVKFSRPFAKLPVLTKQGKKLYALWGRRCQEKGRLPLGGCLDLAQIRQGLGDEFFARPVKIPLTKFLAHDLDALPHWFDVTAGQYVQGALLQCEEESRLYIVTIKPQQKDAVFASWPRLIRAIFV